MAIGEYLAFFVLSAAETYILHLLFYSLLQPNATLKKWYPVALGCYFIFQVLSYVLLCPLFSTAPLYCAFALAVACLFFTDTGQVKVFAGILFVLLNYACKVLAVAFRLVFSKASAPASPFGIVLTTFDQTMACFFVLAIVVVVSQLRKLVRGSSLVYTVLLCAVPIADCLLIVRLFREFAEGDTGRFSIYMEVAMLMLCCTVFLFFFVDKVMQHNQSRSHAALMAQQLELQERYYSQIEQSQKAISAIRHDIQNHMLCLRSMVELGQVDEATQYIGSICRSIADSKPPIVTGNTVVDSILAQKQADARRAGIDMQVSVIIPPQLPVANLDLCILLGNLLDNAVEACGRMAEGDGPRTIRLKCGVSKGFLVVSVVNSFNGELRPGKVLFESVKNRSFSGIGLSNVRGVVDRYRGSMDIRPQEHQFTVSVMLSLGEAPCAPALHPAEKTGA